MHSSYCRPLFIGLPGSGKTTISTLVANHLGIKVVSTDPLFRYFRVIPSISDIPESTVMRHFLMRVQEDHPHKYSELLRDSEVVDEQGRCALHDGGYFRRQYGESIFRLFEIEMLKYLDESGYLSDKIVDLSGSAPLYEENVALFSPERGYLAILLDADHNLICQNLIKDYETYLSQRETGIENSIRGAYEMCFAEALRLADNDSKDQRDVILYREALSMTQKAAQDRMSKYKAFAKLTFYPTSENPPEELVKEISAKLDEISFGERSV
jgi:shikimate kinase